MDNTLLNYELPVLVTAIGKKMDDSNTPIFALETHTSTPAQSVSDADGTENPSPTLAEFMAAQSADKCYQNDARQLGQAGTELTLNMEGLLVRRAPINDALQNFMPQSL